MLLDQFATGHHDIAAFLIDLHDLEIEGLANILIQVFWRLNIDLRSGQESIHTDTYNQPSFHLASDSTGNDRAFLASGGDLFPIFLLLGFVEGKNRIAILVLEFLEENLYIGADLQFARIDKFDHRDFSLGLPPEIDHDLRGSDFHYGSTNDGTFLQLLDFAVSQQFFH